ncbi:MAG: hypothetical protein V4527_17555 [Pseudomonadota bacterium]
MRFAVGHHLTQDLRDKSGVQARRFGAVPEWYSRSRAGLIQIPAAPAFGRGGAGARRISRLGMQATGRLEFLQGARFRYRDLGGIADGLDAVTDGSHANR